MQIVTPMRNFLRTGKLARAAKPATLQLMDLP